VTQDKQVASRIRVATSFLDRCVGLLTTSALLPEEGLWLKPCKCVHTWFMRYPIDVLFLNPAGEVLDWATLGPWRFSPWVAGAQGVVELQAGHVARSGIRLGDRLLLEKTL